MKCKLWSIRNDSSSLFNKNNEFQYFIYIDTKFVLAVNFRSDSDTHTTARHKGQSSTYKQAAHTTYIQAAHTTYIQAAHTAYIQAAHNLYIYTRGRVDDL